MAAKLPRSSFQKLGLSAAGLSTAFTSLTNSLSVMRTEGGAVPMTLRNVQHEDAAARTEFIQDRRGSEAGWETYHCYTGTLRWKRRFDRNYRDFVDVPLSAGATGVAIYSSKFAHGVERNVFHCTEITGTGQVGWTRATGEWLVTKETRYEEQMSSAGFHTTMAKVQAEAEYLANLFNARVRGGPSSQLNFVECCIYKVLK